MKLSKCLKYLGENLLSDNFSTDIELNDVQVDSRKISTESIFVAVKGSHVNGEDFIPQALRENCKVILAESDLDIAVNFIKVKSTYLAAAQLAAAFAESPAKSLSLIGVTGTNGKTSITSIVHYLLEMSSISTGLIGTIETKFADVSLVTGMTTPDPLVLQSIFCEMREKEVTTVALEVSSHAISQYRLGDDKLDIGVFSNLTQDHLDYHQTMDEYFAVKQKMFTDQLKPDGLAIINIDDTYGLKLFESLSEEKCLTVGLSDFANVRLSDVRFSLNETIFSLLYKQEKYQVKTSLIGEFNVSNLALALVAAAEKTGEMKSHCENIESFPGVSGRLEKFRDDQKRFVFVDYAHTPDALENVLKTLRPLTSKLICIFGCGGDRDTSKRAQMGAIVEKLADEYWITDDNPRTEDGEKIIKEILSGIENKAKVQIERNRESCIEQAIMSLGSDEILLVAGKGHEDYQIYGDEKRSHCDRAIVKKSLGVLSC
ncbi:MAG: UDP-N-acetylmuramoyl-L-alanyl-D-glutamate--2,6-diaminopimelate ligase [Lentisphaeraceae bacterium]|nr:UDP-N-acetylmuramoyl-L-alanyl-D-glutamate--2,6-diaminopimelate ligase [Lentisphaeraceae bacterium]